MAIFNPSKAGAKFTPDVVKNKTHARGGYYAPNTQAPSISRPKIDFGSVEDILAREMAEQSLAERQPIQEKNWNIPDVNSPDFKPIRNPYDVSKDLDRLNDDIDEQDGNIIQKGARLFDRVTSTGIPYVGGPLKIAANAGLSDWLLDKTGADDLDEKRDQLNTEKDAALAEYKMSVERLRRNPDFLQRSLPEPKNMADEDARQYAIYEQINSDANLSGTSQLGEVAGEDRELMESRRRAKVDGRYVGYGNLTKDEKAMFNYLYNTQGGDRAMDYLQAIQEDVTSRQNQIHEDIVTERAQERPAEATLLAIAQSPLKAASFVGQTYDYMKDGTIDPNAGYNLPAKSHEEMVSAVSQKIASSGKWGQVGSFGYNLGVGMGEFLLNTGLGAVTGGGSNLTLGIMGSGAAADTTLAAKERGLSDEQAYSLGVVAGATEAITEKFSLEAFLDPENLAKNAWDYIARNALAEGSEEGAGSIMNLLADILIAGGESEFLQNVKRYQEAGQSPGKALSLAMLESVKSIGLDALGGFISGGMIGSLGTIGKAGNYNGGQNITTDASDAVADTGIENVVPEIQNEVQQEVSEGEQEAFVQEAIAERSALEANRVPVPAVQNTPVNTEINIPAVVGGGGKTYTSGNNAIDFHYAIVPLESLVTSNDRFGDINPAYPQELQPRDRHRASSRQWVSKTSRDLNPALLTYSETAQNGAPIVNGNGVVIGGNGRTAAIEGAYATNESGAGDRYRDHIVSVAPALGIDVSNLPENPVLVRITENVADEVKLANDLNATTTHQYSMTELAESDKRHLDEIMELLAPTEDGNITNANNKDFIQAFLNKIVYPSEVGFLTDKSGKLNLSGLRRIENAVFAYAYDDPGLIESLAESIDPDNKNIKNALLTDAPMIAKLNSAIANGEVQNLGLKEALVEAVDIYQKAKDAGQNVDDFTSQLSLLGDEGQTGSPYNGLAVNLALFMEANTRGYKNLVDFVADFAHNNMDAVSAEESAGSMFGPAEQLTQEELYERATADYRKRKGDKARIPAKADFGDFQTFVETEMARAGNEGESGVTESNAEDSGGLQQTAPGGLTEKAKLEYRNKKQREEDARKSVEELIKEAASYVNGEYWLADDLAKDLRKSELEKIARLKSYEAVFDDIEAGMTRAEAAKKSDMLQEIRERYSGLPYNYENGTLSSIYRNLEDEYFGLAHGYSPTFGSRQQLEKEILSLEDEWLDQREQSTYWDEDESIEEGIDEGTQEAPSDPVQASADAMFNEMAQEQRAAQEAREVPPGDTVGVMGRPTSSESTVGAAEADFNGTMAYEDMLTDDNVQPDRADDVRPDEMLKYGPDGRPVSAVAKNILGAEITPDGLVNDLKQKVMQNGMSYVPTTNNQTTQNAAEDIARLGWDDALAKWRSDIRAGRAGADMSAKGAIFLNNAAASGDKALWLDILGDMQKLSTNTAQGLQAMRIIRQLAPSDKLYMIRRSVRQMVDDMHLDTELTIPEDLAEQYQNEKDPKKADEILTEIQKDLASQIPSTALDKFTAMRYLNMLGNFKTQVRNVVGNLGMKALYKAKDTVATTIENAVWLASGKKTERTNTYTVSRDLLKAARQDFDGVSNTVLDGGKYNDRNAGDDFRQGVEDQRTIFKFKPLELYRKGTNWAMNNEYFGDAGFAKAAYARSLAGYLKAHGWEGNTLDGVDPGLLDAARVHAIQEAQEATFHDSNVISDWIGKVGRRPDTPKAARLISEGIMPFRKTPANVLVRAEEFSPLGLVNSAVETVKMAKGEATANDVINSWAKTLTGTGLTMLGYFLARNGFLTGAEDDDNKKAAFDRMTGRQDYSLRLPGGYNMTIDFLSPTAMPVLIGAQFAEIGDLKDIKLRDMEKVLMSLADPMIQMSMLQGLNDTIDKVKFSEDNMGQFLLNSVMGFVSQGVTNTLLGQIERGTEENRMTTFVDQDGQLPNWAQKQLGSWSAKTPGLDYHQTEYLDAWGRPQKNPGNMAGNLAYQLFSPSYFAKEENDALTNEINRLDGVQDKVNVFPNASPRKVNFTGKDGKRHEDYTLSQEEWTKLQKVQGGTAHEMLTEIVKDPSYKALTDNAKAKVFEKVYEYAKEKGLAEAIKDHPGIETGWMQQLTKGEEGKQIIANVIDSEISKAYSTAAESPTDGVKALDAAWAMYQSLPEDQQRRITKDTAKVRYLANAKESGVSTEDFAKLYRSYNDINKLDIKASEKAAKWANTIDHAVEDGSLTQAQADKMQEDMKYFQIMPADPARYEKFVEADLQPDIALAIDDTLRQLKEPSNADKLTAVTGMDELSDSDLEKAMVAIIGEEQSYKLDIAEHNGMSPERYAQGYTGYTNAETNRKADRIQAIMDETGWPQNTAEWAYHMYSGHMKPKK